MACQHMKGEKKQATALKERDGWGARYLSHQAAAWYESVPCLERALEQY